MPYINATAAITALPRIPHPAVNITAWLLELLLEPLAVPVGGEDEDPEAEEPCCG